MMRSARADGEANRAAEMTRETDSRLGFLSRRGEVGVFTVFLSDECPQNGREKRLSIYPTDDFFSKVKNPFGGGDTPGKQIPSLAK